MDTDNLIRMANRIGAFFAAWPDRSEALGGIAEHVRKFWDPRMRRALRQRLADDAGRGLDPGLDPIVRETLVRFPALLDTGGGDTGGGDTGGGDTGGGDTGGGDTGVHDPGRRDPDEAGGAG